MLLRQIKKYGWIISLTGLFSVFFAVPVFAVTQFSQTDSSASQTLNTNQLPAIKFTAPYNGLLTTSTFYLANPGADYLCTVYRYPKGVNNGIGSQNKLISGNTKTAYDFVWSISSRVTSSDEYYLSLSCATNKQLTIYGKGGTPGSVCLDSSDWGTTCNNASSTLSDYYNVTTDLSGDTDAIDFTSHVTPRANFTSWALNVNLSSSTEAYCSVAVGLMRYGSNPCEVAVIYTNTSTGQVYTDRTGFNPSTFPWQTDVIYLRKRIAMVSGTTWTANAYLWQYPVGTTTPTVFASSDDYTLTINAATTTSYTDWYIPTGATSSVSAGATYECDTSKGWFATGMCNMFLTLFMPSSASIAQFNTLKSEIQNKPPFGYAVIYSEALNSVATTTTSTNDLSNLQSIANFWPLQTLRTIGQWVLYLLFGLWVFNRLRHLEV